jgi:hypothetical protein
MDTKRLLFPIFVLKLVFINTSFFLSVVFMPIQRYKLLFFSLILLGIYLLFFGQYLIVKKVEAPSPIKLFNVNSSTNQIITFKDFSKIKHFENKINGLRTISPDNKNILLNLALLKFYQNEIDSYQELWISATDLDPNNPLFNNL